MYFWEANLAVLLHIVTNPLGLLGVCVLITLAMLTLTREWALQYALILYLFVLFIGPVAQMEDITGAAYQPIMQPFETIRQDCRAIMALMFLIVVPATLRSTGFPTRSAGSILYLILQLAWSFFQLLFDGFDPKIVIGDVLFICVWIVATGQPMRTRGDWFRALRPISWAIVIFVACHVLLIALGSPGMLINSRLQGMTSNPQFTAQNLATACVIFAALAADKEMRRGIRMPLWLVWATLGTVIAMLGMTGSRGGALFAAVAIVCLFGTKIVRALIAIVPATAAAYFFGTYFFYSDASSSVALNRIFSGEDSRSGLIRNLYDQWMLSPILGSGGEMTGGFAECLYLFVALKLGIFGLLYLVTMVVIICISCYGGAIQARKRKGIVHRLPFAFVTGLAVQNITEAGLLSQFAITTTVYLLCCELAMHSHLLVEDKDAPAPIEELLPLDFGYAA